MPFGLNADELGEKGQARFKEICADAKVICNQSGRDRTGWDFIVEFPFEAAGAEASFEDREAPLSCHVQVKTLLETTDRFNMRLSSAERLAKEPKPSFIYVLKVNEGLQFTGAYLIHVLDDPLAKILKRLRKEETTSAQPLNKKVISLSARASGRALAPTGAALRDALRSACGENMGAYIAQKQRQLKTLGFESPPYEVKATLIFDNVDGIVDAFLGLQDQIPATDLSTSITRFGIKKVLPSPSGEVLISIQPHPIDSCTITVRADAVSPPAVFRGRVFMPAVPNLPQEKFKILFDADLFYVLVGHSQLSITGRDDISPMRPTMWAAYWRLMLVMANGSGTIEIVSDTKPIRSTLNIRVKTTSLDPKECAHWLELCERACAVLKSAGVLEEPAISMWDLHENGDGINSLFALLNPQIAKAPARIVTEFNDRIATPYSHDVLYADFLQLGSVSLGCYGVGTLVGTRVNEQIHWQCDNVSMKGIRRFNSFPQEYRQMIDAAKAETGCKAEWLRQPNSSGRQDLELDA